MPTPLKHAPGTPAWCDHQSPDPAASRAFYGAVLGWEWQVSGPEFGHYANALIDGKPAAGLGPVPPQAPKVAAWTVYLSSADVDADTAKIKAAGGAPVMEPMDVGDFGRMVVAADPTGAMFGLWQPGTHDGFEVRAEHGWPCWFEVNTPDAVAIKDFYAGLWGNAATKLEGMDYFTISDGERPRHGVLQTTEAWEGIPPHWMVYFAVADADASAAVVTAQGGAVKHGPFDTPFGRMAVCQDPQGAVFTIMTPPPQG